MKRLLAMLLPLGLTLQIALATGANPDTGDHSIVGIAMIAAGAALVLMILMLVLGRRKK